MKRSGTRSPGQSGQALVELAVMLPVLVVVLAAAAELGRLALVKIQLATLVRAVAREAAELPSGKPMTSEMAEKIRKYVAPGLDGHRLRIEIGSAESTPGTPDAGGGLFGSGSAAFGFPVTARYSVPVLPVFTRVFGMREVTVASNLHFYARSWSLDFLKGALRGRAESAKKSEE